MAPGDKPTIVGAAERTRVARPGDPQGQPARGPRPFLTCTHGPAGWWCSRSSHHGGPCALWPRWWNLPGRYAMRSPRHGVRRQ